MSQNQTEKTYNRLLAHAREAALLASIEGLVSWDQHTMLPPAGGEYRARQLTYLSGELHKMQTRPELGEWLAELSESELADDPHSDAGSIIRNMRRVYDKKVKLPQKLVEELAHTSSQGQHIWVEARAENDFARFQPVLEKTFRLKREEAEAVGYEELPYDALLDDYEPTEKTSNVAKVLAGLREELVPLIEAIGSSPREADTSIIRRRFPVEVQEKFGTEAAAKIGFDFTRGRLDVTAHPFCGGAGPNDTRITTRYEENFFNSAFFGILHEAGHGIYEQGLRGDQFGLPSGTAISLGIHESQSRLWENLVGRSRSFWHYFYPLAQQAFSQSLQDVAQEDFFFAVNDVRPSLIRVEADEATYNLHILIRFELEQALINDELQVADLPAAWNTKYQDYLGIAPESDADGVMQDIHWSAGLIGYFATYSLGNLYASQLFEAAESELGDLNALFARGEFLPLKEWLNKNIHTKGQNYSAAQLAQQVTGKPLEHAPLMRHLRSKYSELYDLG